MKDRGLPVFIYAGHIYLTPKQQTQLQLDGYLMKPDYKTGYYVCPSSPAFKIAEQTKEKIK